LLETTNESLEASIRLFEKWDGAESGRLRYVFSPRYAGSCSMELMREVAEFAATNNARIQSHLSENRAEVAWVRSLFPEFPSYTAVYAAAGLLGPRTVMGHCVHVDETETSWLAATGTAVAFCPCSNRTLRSGEMPFARLREKGLNIGLATDIAGGPTLSMFRQMDEAVNMGLTPAAAFYHATAGAASALGISREVGSFEPGKEADFVVLSPEYFGTYNQVEDVVSRLCRLGDREMVESVWVRGKEIYRKEKARA
jgi:guanine deaminase